MIKILLAALPTMMLVSTTFAQPANEWPCYGRDAGGARYSPLSQVSDSNVTSLDTAWVFHTGELQTYTGTYVDEKAAFEATPIMIGKSLYFSTATDRVFSLDAATGKQLWLFDPKVNLYDDYSEITSRGVSAWPAAAGPYSIPAQIIFIATIDGRLIALQAYSGKPITAFGTGGTVDLKKGYGRNISVTSPPAIIGDLVVVGSSLGDNNRFDETRGSVRAFDVHTGAERWSWDVNPRDSASEAWKTWNGDHAHRTGAGNAWAVLSVDPKLGLVFVPTSSPSPDYYGGERPGANRYANSLVALRASNGKPVWDFQVVHHDIWDYDIAAQPMLIDWEKDGRTIPAVVVGTKMGHIFVLDRKTGQPLLPVEERPVPASAIAGEQASPTQPFPVLPKPLGLRRITPADAWGVDADDSLLAAARISKYLNQGIFTPPSLQGSIITPGNVGGIHWGGMCYDAAQGLLLTNINRLAAVITLRPRGQQSTPDKNAEELLRAETGAQYGTPYILKRSYLFRADSGTYHMQTRPPWGTLLAVDLRSGEQKWEVPLGFMMNPKKYPQARQWGSINLGGATATAGNLTFVAATLDGYFRAFNTRTGQLLWEWQLPAGGQATPMTYSIKGKQYVVIAAGGHGKVHTRPGDSLLAFALK